MKTKPGGLKQLFLFLSMVLAANTLFAQDKEGAVKSAIESKRFVFNAQRVLPMSGRVRQLSGESYEVRVLGDSLVSYLPYFGRAYSAPLNSEGGIKFTSLKFDYSLKAGRKSGWEILIKPKDNNEVREFSLTIGDNGSARLQAISNNRQPISFDGYIDVAK